MAARLCVSDTKFTNRGKYGDSTVEKYRSSRITTALEKTFSWNIGPNIDTSTSKYVWLRECGTTNDVRDTTACLGHSWRYNSENDAADVCYGRSTRLGPRDSDQGHDKFGVIKLPFERGVNAQGVWVG